MDTGYQINSIAGSLKRSRSNVIRHLLNSTVPNPFFVKVERGVESFAQENGYTRPDLVCDRPGSSVIAP